MKVTYRNRSGNLSCEFEADSPRELFVQLATFQEVFDEGSCGKCDSTELRFIVRDNNGNQYYELKCLDCGAKLAYGLNRKGGGLFPKRKSASGEWLPDRGWTKWNNQTKSVE